VTRPATCAAFLCLAQLLAAAPCRASSPVDGGAPGDRPTLSADFGARPYTPALCSSESTAPTASTWAAPGAPVASLSLQQEAAFFFSPERALPPGFSRGLERPPKRPS
jgi:hypothetical protein